MRPADPGQLRPAWLRSGRFDQLRSAETSSVGSKIGARFASVLKTELIVKPSTFARIECLGPTPSSSSATSSVVAICKASSNRSVTGARRAARARICSVISTTVICETTCWLGIDRDAVENDVADPSAKLEIEASREETEGPGLRGLLSKGGRYLDTFPRPRRIPLCRDSTPRA